MLTVYVIFLAIFGGYLATLMMQNMNISLYINTVIKSIEFTDLIPGIAKTFVFGYIVGLVGTYKGFNADNGTVGVGKASTSSVVVSSLLILLVDMVLVRITILLWSF
jgi:phospholipid/cholesterol/gamma-HCH transport system permease protein